PFRVEVLAHRLAPRRTADPLNERRPPKPWRAPHVATLVCHDREEPWAYRHPRPQLVQLAPGAGQRLLCGVLGIPPIPQHREREAQPWLDEGSEQRLERRLVAGDCPQPEWFVSRVAQCVRHTQ